MLNCKAAETSQTSVNMTWRINLQKAHDVEPGTCNLSQKCQGISKNLRVIQINHIFIQGTITEEEAQVG